MSRDLVGLLTCAILSSWQTRYVLLRRCRSFADIGREDRQGRGDFPDGPCRVSPRPWHHNQQLPLLMTHHLAPLGQRVAARPPSSCRRIDYSIARIMRLLAQHGTDEAGWLLGIPAVDEASIRS